MSERGSSESLSEVDRNTHMLQIMLTKEVAKMLRLSEEYVRELIRQRKLKAYQEGKRGGYRIEFSEVKRYIKSKYSATKLKK